RSLRLTGSISESQETGKYSAGTGVTVRVAEPRVSVDVFDADGEKVGSGAEVRANSVLLVGANWNYAEAEDVEIEVIDSDTVDDEEDPGTEGTNVETKALSSRVSTEQLGLLPDGFNEGYLSKRVQGVGSTGYRTAFWGIDVSKLSAGEYEIHVTGVDDLNSGSARETFKMNVGNERRAYVTTERSSVPRGDLLRYT
ncbi:MAG: hypothetical protein SV760_00535, partial [Halobacteria archaeon]|nr:hypothetical protein [Halobacteria archaeon]